jgi:uncharacterized protein (DUF1810 family)
VSPSSDYDLQRFLDAQQGVFERALAELCSGAKRSHWMWFIFPQIAGLGQSAMSRRYAIASLGEAIAYASHPLLGPRLRDAVQAVLAWQGQRDAAAIFGPVDAMKLRSSLTLFAAAAPGEPLFEQALIAFVGSPDPETLKLLNG